MVESESTSLLLYFLLLRFSLGTRPLEATHRRRKTHTFVLAPLPEILVFQDLLFFHLSLLSKEPPLFFNKMTDRRQLCAESSSLIETALL